MSGMHQMPDCVGAEIAAKLVELQGSRTDADMARDLGITRPHWNYIRSGKRSPSYALVKRALVVFPALYPILMRDLAGEKERAAS